MEYYNRARYKERFPKNKQAIVEPGRVYVDPEHDGSRIPAGTVISVSERQLADARGVLAEVGSDRHARALKIFERMQSAPILIDPAAVTASHRAHRNRVQLTEAPATATTGAPAKGRG